MWSKILTLSVTMCLRTEKSGSSSDTIEIENKFKINVVIEYLKENGHIRG